MYDPLAGVTTLLLRVWVVTPAIGPCTPPSTYPDVFLILLLMNNSKLDKVSSYNYLGVYLDMNLNYHKYLQTCLQRTTHKVYMLSKVWRYIDFNTAITVYKTMILPVLEYGDVAYDNSDTKLLNKLQVLQNRALRICLNGHKHVPVVILHR